MTLPPTAKLPCSWMVSGSNLDFLISCALAEMRSTAAINEAAAKVFRLFLFIRILLRAIPRSSLLIENFLGDGDGIYRVRPATVERQVSDGLYYLFLRNPVLPRPDQMRPKLFRTIQGNQRSHSDEASVAL